MARIPSNLTTGGNATTTASDTTATFTPNPGALIIASCACHRGSAVPTTISISDTFAGGIGAWQTVGSLTGAAARSTLFMFYTFAGPNPGTHDVTFTYSGGGGNPIRKAWIIDQRDFVATVSPIVQAKTGTSVSSTTLSFNLDNAIVGNNMTYSVCDNPSGTGITAGTNETEIVEISSTGTANVQLQSQYGTAQDETLDWSTLQSTATDNLGIAFEIREATFFV